MSKTRATLGLAFLPIFGLFAFGLMVASLAWVFVCDLLPANLDEIRKEWRK